MAARWAHNPKVGSSNLPPATKKINKPKIRGQIQKEPLNFRLFIWRRSSAGQSNGIIIRVSGVRIPAPLPSCNAEVRMRNAEVIR